MKKSTFDELLTSVEQVSAILKREEHPPSRKIALDVPAIRRHLGLTQERFAMLLGISPCDSPELRAGEEQASRCDEGAVVHRLEEPQGCLRRRARRIA